MQTINVGTNPNDGTGDTLRNAFIKVQSNFDELVAIDASFSGDIQTLNTIISDGSTLNHTHTISQIIGLQTALSGKVSTSTFNTQILAINSSIQAINSTLSDIIDILNTKIADAPFSGITYGRRDGAWVEISGGTPSGDYVPYTGATKDVDLGEYSITAGGGLFVSPFLGNGSNFFNVGTYYGGNPNFRQILFSNYGDDIEFSSDKSITVSANIEEGFSATVTEADGQLGQIAVNYSGINLQVNDNTDTNITSMYPDYTDYQRKLITQEGFEGNYVQFNTAATETSAVAKLKWNDVDGTLDLGLKGGAVTLQLGQEQVARVVNKTSPLIDLLEADYQVVKIVGATGQRLSVALAQADSTLNSAVTLGVVTETILRNQEGFITTNGQVKEINTTGSLQGETWDDGDVLYLSADYPGQLTNVRPSAPNKAVIIGFVEYAHSQHGKIYVRIDAGLDINGLDDVSISGVTNSQTLSYNASLGVWENNDEILLQTKRMYNSYRASANSMMVIGATTGYNLGAGQTTRTFTGNAYEKKQRVGVVSLTGANQSTSYRNALLHFTLDGVEYFEQTFGNAEGMTTAGVRAIHGISTNVGVISGNIEYNTVTDFIGVCKLSTSNNWHVVHNDNTGLATTIDLGSNFPANVTQEVFTYRITPKATNNVDVTFTRNSTGLSTTVNITTNMPSTAVLYTGKGALNNNTSTVAVGFDFFAVTELFK
jgi:hypothetical protein